MPSPCLTLAAIGFHLASYHTAPNRNNVNPGVYATSECGLTAGVYLNSYRKTSTYVGYVYDVKDLPVFASVALVTGYPKHAVIVAPLVGLRADVGNARFRLGYAPKVRGYNAGHLLHLTVEFKL